MARPRSPNYPAISLAKAIEAVRPVLKRENCNKMSNLVLAKHLGSNTLNGRVMARIGALRAYGLIEGSGDGLHVSDDALVLTSAPEDSRERQAALERCAFRPAIFKKLREESPDLANPPSIENLQFGLMKGGFTQGAAGKAAKSYLATIGLVTGKLTSYDSEEQDGEESSEVSVERQSTAHNSARRDKPPSPLVPPAKQETNVMVGERVVFTEEGQPNQYLKLIAAGEVDDLLLEALEDFVKRRRKLLEALKRQVGSGKRPADNSDGSHGGTK